MLSADFFTQHAKCEAFTTDSFSLCPKWLYVFIHWNFNGSNIFGPWKFVRDMSSSSHWELIMAPVKKQIVII